MTDNRGIRRADRPRRDAYITQAPLAPLVAVLAAATFFGTTGTVLTRGPQGIDALTAASLRLLIGGSGLCLLSRGRLRATFGHFGPSSSGAVAVAIYQTGFFWATQKTGVALATVVTIGSSPIVARVIAVARKRATPNPWWRAAAATLILGLVLLVTGSMSGSVTFHPLGILSAVLAGGAYAAYTEFGSILMVRGCHPTASMAIMFFGAGIVTSPLLAFRDVSWVSTPSGLATIGYLSFVTLTLAYVWFGWGLKRLLPTTVVMLTMFEPVVAAVLAVLVLGERLAALSWSGMAVVLVGLAMVGLRSRESMPTTVTS